ncbi:SH3 domain-containing protein [Sulfurovum mangrovi]|uniref:SH3 domain-containing protein n=1 Tax=Sulfurovum mangrovi TaxID=2893889 RepID=UPI001E326EF7|nr:SH3 domain-containing protein [Sulfurovum mangrovi]UFH58132.1 SH3 domain-containing protein [Sulfurovum mangrovi]
MKKIILLILFTVISYPKTVDIYKVVNVSSLDTLNVRSGDSADYNIVGELPYNAKNIRVLSCIERKGKKWCNINHISSAGNTTGWVNARYIKLYEKRELASTLKSDTTTKLSHSSSSLIYRIKRNLSLRDQPTTNSATLDTVTSSQKVVILTCKKDSEKEEWCKVRSYDTDMDGEANGWIKKSHLETYTNVTYINMTEGLDIDIFPTSESRTPSTTLTQSQNCYFSLQCDNDRCNIIYDIDMSGDEITLEDIKMGWVSKDILIAATKFTAMPADAEEGFCITNDTLQNFLEQQKDKR